jgi:aminoglycoside 6-adenylyltransferase
MRSEKEILDLILETARQDERIRAVVMNGSRVNPNAPRDFFQDFDVVYFVTDVTPFRRNFEWIRRFGETMILQTPEDMDDPAPNNDGGYNYLMQFKDGNRIDLAFDPLSFITEITSDSLTTVLLDKDGCIPALPPANDGDYLPKPPTAKAFFDCSNEFWWVSAYVAKGLWRGEFSYARHMLDVAVREQLTKMLTWYIGVQTGFAVSAGKYGKYFQKYLEPELWALLLKTYAAAGGEATWEALFAMGDLFRLTAAHVADYFGYDYPYQDDENVSAHLQHVRRLPREAKEMY